MRRHDQLARGGCKLAAILLMIAATPAVAQSSPPRIDITQYCDATEEDHSECIRRWLRAGIDAPGSILSASGGVYRYSSWSRVYPGMRLECIGSQKTLFQSRQLASGAYGSGALFRATEPVRDVRIAGCAFDVNGNPENFLAVIDISAEQPAPSTRIRVNNNRIFDSRGTPFPPGLHNQRQYITLLNCVDCRVEGNRLSNGGRIRVGRPGRNIVIRGNTVEEANDNAITVSDRTNGVSEKIVIERNRILQPVGIGIYIGGDADKGKDNKWPDMRLRNVSIRGNYVEGSWRTACIFGRLPWDASDIRIYRNRCLVTGAWNENDSVAGIRLERTCEATPPARNIRIDCNSVASATPAGILGLGGISMAGIHSAVRIAENQVSQVGAIALYLKYVRITNAEVVRNILRGGGFAIQGDVTGVLQPHTQTPASGAIPESCEVANPS